MTLSDVSRRIMGGQSRYSTVQYSTDSYVQLYCKDYTRSVQTQFKTSFSHHLDRPGRKIVYKAINGLQAVRIFHVLVFRADSAHIQTNTYLLIVDFLCSYI